MTVSIVACGESAHNWFEVPVDESVGVNDCEKWGRPVNNLICVNTPTFFKNGRLETIINSKPQHFYTHVIGWWSRYFPKAIHLSSIEIYNSAKLNGHNYFHGKTSPLLALCMAYNLGASNIIMWGVDFENHSFFHKQSPHLPAEVFRYKRLFGMLADKGVRVYLGNDFGVFSGFLPVWNDSAR